MSKRGKISRKAQISMYIAIGIIIIAALGIFYYSMKNKYAVQEPYSSKVQAEYIHFLDSCAEYAVQDSVSLLLDSGSLDSDNYIYVGNSTVALFFLNGTSRLPRLSDHEMSLSSSIKDNFRMCIITNFPESLAGYNYAGANTSVNVTFTDQDIYVKLESPSKIEVDGNSYIYRGYVTHFQYRFPAAFFAAEGIVNKTANEPAYVPYSYISTQTVAVKIEPLFDADNNIHYLVYDIYPVLGEDSLPYRFAVEVDVNEELE